MSSPYRYPWRALFPDYAGSGIGFGLLLAALVFAHPAVPMAWVLAAAAALFLVYFGRTVCRQLTHIELDETGIRVAGPAFLRLRAALRWEELRSLRLDYYSIRRDPEGRTLQGGWMQLRLRDARCTIRIDSELEGFLELLRVAAREARRRDADLDWVTRANLGALGLAE